MVPGLGFVHLVVVAIVALLVLGPDKLPDLARRAGHAYRDLQRLREHLQLDVETLLGANDDALLEDHRADAPTVIRPAVAAATSEASRGVARPARHVPPRAIPFDRIARRQAV